MKDLEPGWFGPPDRPLFGWVHRPSSGTVRGAVVVCGSLGLEATISHFTLRTVANRLADLGFVVVRFDYDGTGDSIGHSEEPHRVTAWLKSIDAAIDLARSYTSAPLSLLGMRLGALLAVSAAERRDDVHGLVLWDSPRSGSSYIREQRVRQNTSVGGADTGEETLTALGLNLTAATREELNQVNLRALPGLPADAVLAADRPNMHALARHATTRAGTAAERVEAPDQDDLMAHQILPLDTENAVVDWFDRIYTDSSFPVDPCGDVHLSSTLDVPGGTERIVRIGSADLFGILSEPHRPRTSTTVVFVPDNFTPHIGLSRIWSDTSRTWCQAGIGALRFDLSGCGDSEPRPGYAGHEVKILEHIDEVDETLHFVSPDDPSDAVLIGLCSGAYHCLETALDLGPRGVVLINPLLGFPSHEQPVSKRRRAIQLTRPVFSRPFGALAGRLAWMLSPRYRSDPTFEWRRMLEACWWQRAAGHQLAFLPEWVWTVLNWVLVQQRPEQLMRRVLARGTSVLWISGGHDYLISTIGSRRALRRIERTGRFRLELMEEMDHAMMRPGVMGRVITQLTEFVEEHIAPPAHTPATERGDLDARRGIA